MTKSCVREHVLVLSSISFREIYCIVYLSLEFEKNLLKLASFQQIYQLKCETHNKRSFAIIRLRARVVKAPD